jgi:alkanesulfonate monooxygenase SsuD/methylene tetrahydromethanopterin reductase-like flavin-dependent oxidoreductase (luciferase family)
LTIDAVLPPEMNPAALKLGLFDIMQVDPVLQPDARTMYQQRLDHLALADELGFDIAFSAERHFLPNHVCPSATAWIAAATQRTRKMRLGVLGYTLPLRETVELSEEVAVLDHLAGGRLDIGFGLGHRIEELGARGIDPSTRIGRFQERLAVLQALWSGGKVSFEKGDLVIRDVAINPVPYQDPHPPLWFAGTDAAAAQWMAARGLGLAVGFKPTDQLVPAVAAFFAGRQARTPESIAAEPERPAGSLALMRHVYVSDTDDRARDDVMDDLMLLDETFGAKAASGSRDDHRKTARERYEQMLRDDVMIAGGPETVARMIAGQQQVLRFDLFLSNVYAAGVTPDRIERSLRLLAGPVREALVAMGSEVRMGQRNVTS